jgi:hypothetical protein
MFFTCCSSYSYSAYPLCNQETYEISRMNLVHSCKFFVCCSSYPYSDSPLCELETSRISRMNIIYSCMFVLRSHILILLHVNKDLMKFSEWISFLYMTHHEDHRSNADIEKHINPHFLSLISFLLLILTNLSQLDIQKIRMLRPQGGVACP